MDTKNMILLGLIILIFVFYFIIMPIAKYKGIQKNNEKHSDFLSKLNIGDRVVLTSGIFGVLKEKNEEEYSIEVSKGFVIKVLPSSIIGRS